MTLSELTQSEAINKEMSVSTLDQNIENLEESVLHQREMLKQKEIYISDMESSIHALVKENESLNNALLEIRAKNQQLSHDLKKQRKKSGYYIIGLCIMSILFFWSISNIIGRMIP